MSVAALAGVLLAGLGVVAVVLNHVYARIALVEVALNEGLPPGHATAAGPAGSVAAVVAPASVASMVGPGLHIFVSRSCHACQRLVEETSGTSVTVQGPVTLHYVDRPRPTAAAAAAAIGAELRADDAELAGVVGADPLPFAIAVGDHGLVARGVTPTLALVLDVARDAGLVARRAETAR